MPNLNHEATAFFKLEGGDETRGYEKLRRALDALDGVLEVRVNFIIDTISVRYDSDRLTRDDIKKKVDQSNRVSKNR